jgi:hypothetical protein
MQIHELNKGQQVNEVDLVGPNSIFNVGKQVLKNPAALVKSSALGAAQQAAAQASAVKSADKLAAQGYQVGGSVKPATTVAQKLQTVRTNPAVQQQVRNLTAQWMTQSSALKRSMPVTEAVAVFNPSDLTDPKYASVLKAMQAKGGQPTTPSPEQAAATDIELEKKLTAWKTQFRAWSDPKLQAGGITIDAVRRDPETAKLLDSQLSNVAVAAQSGDMNVEQQAVQEYFNTAIAAIQAYEQNTSQRIAPVGSVASVPAADQDQQALQQLEQLGITRTALASLGKLMAQSAKGKTSVNDTGNPLLNAIAKMSGMTVR